MLILALTIEDKFSFEKNPVLEKMDDLVQAINFLAQNHVTNGDQLTRLNEKLMASFQEAKEVLGELDEKLIELSKIEKQLLSNPNLKDLSPINDVKKERTALSLERNILQ